MPEPFPAIFTIQTGGIDAAGRAGGGDPLAGRTFLEGISWSFTPILGTVMTTPALVQPLAMVTKVSGIDRFFVYGDTQSDS